MIFIQVMLKIHLKATQTFPQKNAEASYEWNSDKSDNKSDSTEYHYSYVNGNNKDASHNPNRYNEPTQYSSQNTSSGYSNNYQNPNTNAYDNYQSNGYTAQNQQSQNVYNSNLYGTAPNHSANAKPPKAKKPKKQRKPISRGGIAIALAVTMVFSCGLGFGGGYFANKVNTSTSGSLNITKTSNSGTTTNCFKYI